MRNFFLVALLFPVALHTQPMSGSYTAGGVSADFATLQNAADALKARGVAGPVFINIRPGTYVRQGNPGPVITLDTVVTGVSPTNRITFQPDLVAGGNPANVILKIDCNSSTDYNSAREIVYLGADYTTFRNLTFVDTDSMDSPARFLLRVSPVVFANTTIEGLEVEGCTFVGSTQYPHGQQFGTDFGVYAGGGLISARISNCRFVNLLRAIDFDMDSAPSGDSLVAENNQFEHLYAGFTGAGTPLGSALQGVFAHISVRGNVVSQSNGVNAVQLVYPVDGIVEDNFIRGDYRSSALGLQQTSTALDRSLSVLCRNNVLVGAGSLTISIGHVRIVHNTIIQSGSSGSTGLSIIGAHCAAINNILLAYGGTLAYDQFGATDLLSDHNVIFSTCTYLARDGGNYYFNFDAYRAATGRDSGSHFTDVSFTTDSLGIHLSECEAQNRDLEGIPLPDVPIDFYGARRDTVKPFVGAVEGVRLPYDMFGAPFKASLPGFAVSLAEGEFDNASAPGIAVTDYDHRQLLLFHNNGASRSFSPAGTLATGFRPTVVRLFDLDGDSHLDLIVAGDTTEASIEVFWGNGTGGFSGPASVATNGRVRSLRGGPRFVNFSTVVTTEDNGFLPNKGFIGYLMCSAGRQLCYDVQTTGPNAMPDTVLAVMDDFVLADVGGGRSMPAVAAPGIFGSTNPQPKFLVFDVAPISDAAAKCQQASARFLSNDLEFSIPSTGYYTAGSSIIWGDFDSDGDNDFLTTGWSEDYCVFIRNQGGFSFTADTIPASAARGLVALDYENDGDLDFVTINRTLDSLGVTVFLNSGAGQFAERRNCYYPFASGWPNGIVARDFDSDGKTDIAVIGKTMSGGDSLFVLYNLGGFNTVTGIVDRRPTEGPQGFLVSQNYPNPFNPSTHIEYTIQVPAHVTVTIYNLLGQTVRSLVAEDQPGGRHVIEWDGNSALGTPVSTGVYLCRIEARRIADLHVFADVKKMLLMK